MVPDQTEVIDFLSQSGAYGGDDPVERIDTHISAVFLVGNRVYKLKRAVRFSFLDYSDPERRRHFCHAEVATNRRTAPTLYEGVVPVVRSEDGSLSLNGTGVPIDWVVVMRRFDQSGLWDALAREGALTPAMVNTLADEIAVFHLNAEVPSDAPGHRATIRTMEQIETELARFVPGVFDERAIAQFTKGSRNSLLNAADLLDRRASAGAVRRCHGDLHLRNICQLDGRPQLFDAIEFSDSLSVIDVLYDLAFLIMDLDHRRLRPLANLLLGRYLSLTQDYRGLAALPLFVSLRAAIRAHVTASAAVHADDPRDDYRTARHYLDQAAHAMEAPPPRLIAIGGLSGSGKSTQARRLAPSLGPVPGAIHLQSDVIRKRLAGVTPETRLDRSHYAPDVSRRVYRQLRRSARRALAAGYSVVVDATFLDPEERRAIEVIARTAKVPFRGLWLHAPTGTMERRIAGRRGDASDAVVEVLRHQVGAGPVETDWTQVPTGSGADATADLIANVLGLGGAPPVLPPHLNAPQRECV